MKNEIGVETTNTLSVRRRRFAEEYCFDFNGQAAAIRAGYAPKWADRYASNLLKDERITAYIDDLTRSKEAKKIVATPEYIVQKVVDGINEAETKGNLNAYFRGLELLMRHKGMFVDKQEISGPNGGPIENVQVQQDAQNFTNLLKQLAERADKQEPEIKRAKQ